MADLLHSFKALNIPIDESTIEEFVHIDDENNEVLSKEIFDDVNEMLEMMQAKNDNSEDESDHAVAEAGAQFLEPAEDNFGRFEFMYEKFLEVEDQLLCPDVQAQVGDDCNELKNSFERFQRKLRQVILEAKHKSRSSMYQLTIHDMFEP